MKRAKILLFLLFLLIIPYVSSQSSDCPYSVTESYSENEMVLTYEDSNVINGKVPVFSDFAKGNKSSSFMVFNPNDYELVIAFNYTVEGHGGANRNYGLKVSPYNYSQVRETCYADNTFGECNINQSTLKYFILKPQIMYPKDLIVNKTHEVCCPSGQKNCSNSCITPSTKTAGEAYSCDWECESGVGIEGICKWSDGHICTQSMDCLSGKCNFAGFCGPYVNGMCPNGTENCNDIRCAKPSNKTEGEAYYCDWECVPGTTAAGTVCQKSFLSKTKNFAISVGLIALIFCSALYIYRTGNKEAAKTKKELKEVEERLAEMKRKLTDAEQKYSEIKNKIKENELEIVRLRSEIDNAEGEAKRRFEEKMRKLEKENAIQIKKLEEEESEIQGLSIKTNAARWQLPAENLCFEGPYIKFRKHKDGISPGAYLHIYVADKEIFRPNIEWFKEHYPDKSLGRGGLEVHHIDDDKCNNEPINLAIISKEQHATVYNTDIPKGSWDKGIQILKELGIKQPHIPKLRI